MKREIVAFALIFTLLAACGAGQRPPRVSSTPQPSPAASSTPQPSPTVSGPVQLLPPQLIMFVGDRKTLLAFLTRGGSVNTGSWQSSNPAVASVDAAGNVVALAVGSSTITVTTEVGSASAIIAVTPEPKGLKDVLAHFPFARINGRAQVYSDISPAFSQEHGDHLALVYNYLARVFASSYGGAAVAYYTQDEALYQRIFAYCPSVVVKGGRSVTGCYDPSTGVQSLIIIPYTIPDFGTQQHEVSLQFLFATWPPADDNPWFMVGAGMFWESGTFDPSGELVVITPMPYLRNGIRRFRNSLLPLERLVNMNRNEFYGDPEPFRLYSQSGMLLFYLMQKQPAAMSRVFAALNGRSISNNAQLVSLIVAESGLTLDELDRAYVSYALTL